MTRSRIAGHADEDDRGGLERCIGRFRRGAVALWRAWKQRSQVSGSTTLLHGAQHHVASPASGVRQLEQHLEAVLAAQPLWRVAMLSNFGPGVLANFGPPSVGRCDRSHDGGCYAIIPITDSLLNPLDLLLPLGRTFRSGCASKLPTKRLARDRRGSPPERTRDTTDRKAGIKIR